MIFPRSLTTGDTSDSTYTSQITADTTAHTMGTFVQLFSALAFDVYQIDLYVAEINAGTVDTSALLNVGIDAAGGTTYTVLVPDVLIGFAFAGNQFGRGSVAQFPVYIPAGATVAVQIQSIVTGGETAEVGMTVHGGTPDGEPFPKHGLIVAYGVTAASSSGTTPGNANANVKGAWVELTSATTHPHRGLVVSAQGADGVLNNDSYLIDIGIGAVGVEVVLIADIWVVLTGGELVLRPALVFPFRRDVPEGSRLSIRAQVDTTDSQDNLDVAVYGWG